MVYFVLTPWCILCWHHGVFCVDTMVCFVLTPWCLLCWHCGVFCADTVVSFVLILWCLLCWHCGVFCADTGVFCFAAERLSPWCDLWWTGDAVCSEHVHCSECHSEGAEQPAVHLLLHAEARLQHPEGAGEEGPGGEGLVRSQLLWNGPFSVGAKGLANPGGKPKAKHSEESTDALTQPRSVNPSPVGLQHKIRLVVHWV